MQKDHLEYNNQSLDIERIFIYNISNLAPLSFFMNNEVSKSTNTTSDWRWIITHSGLETEQSTSLVAHVNDNDQALMHNLERTEHIRDGKEVEVTFMRHSKSPYHNYTLATNPWADLTEYVDYKN